jgi:hypothetical protein
MQIEQPKGLVDYLTEMFSAGYGISALAEELDAFKAQRPENTQLKVTMMTPDIGEVMRVRLIKPVGFQMFFASGFVDGEPHSICGHIPRLAVSATYENLTEESETDFTIELPDSAH